MRIMNKNPRFLGMGFGAWFLGLLHMEIIQERLDREFDLDLIPTAPSVVYQVDLTDGSAREIYNPLTCRKSNASGIREPWIKATILTPDEYLGGLLKLCEERRGEQINLSYVGSKRLIDHRLPLNEIVFDFYDRF